MLTLEGEAFQAANRLVNRANDVAAKIVKSFIAWVRATTRMSDLPLSSEMPSLAGPVRAFDVENGLPLRVAPGATMFAQARDPDGKYNLRADDITQIIQRVQQQAEIPIAETLLADSEYYARRTVNDFQRAVLMAAIACEVKVKTVLRMHSNETQRTLVDFALDSPREITITAADGLFDKLLRATFKRSLRLEDKALFRDIQDLYKIRNRIAHSGVMPTGDDARRVVRGARKVFKWLDSITDGLIQTTNAANSSLGSKARAAGTIET